MITQEGKGEWKNGFKLVSGREVMRQGKTGAPSGLFRVMPRGRHTSRFQFAHSFLEDLLTP